jgi:hypothetical protein
VDFFNLPNPSSHTMTLGSTQPLTEMSTRNLPGGKGRPARKADNLTVICEPIVYRKCGSLTCLHDLLQGLSHRVLPLRFSLEVAGPYGLHTEISQYFSLAHRCEAFYDIGLYV